MNSYDFGKPSYITEDISNLYHSIYESKKIDQDEDGDADFADVRVARMIASGVPKAEAIRKTRKKSYNEDFDINQNERIAQRLSESTNLEDVVDIATSHFYEEGLNQYGIDILIEKLGIYEFSDFVLDISESYNLLEWRRGPGGTRIKGEGKSKSGKDISTLKGAAKSAAIRGTAEHKARKNVEPDTTPSRMTQSLRDQETKAAVRKQPETKKPEPEVKKGMGGRISAALSAVANRAKADTELLKKSWNTAREVGRGAEARAGKLAGTVAGGLHGAAIAAHRAGTEFAKSETGKQVKAGIQKTASAAGEGIKAGSSAVRSGKTLAGAAGSAAGTFVRRMRKEEVEAWVNDLLDEGYDLSDYTWDELGEIYLDEEVDKRRAPKELIDRLNASIEGYMAQDGPNRPAYEAKQRLLKKAHEKRNKIKEQVDIYDVILSHLLDEGFVDDYESANRMIEGMSEDWMNEILKSKNWIQKAIKKKGSLSKQLGVPEEKNIPSKMLSSAAKKGGKMGRRARLAQTLRKFH